MIRDGYRLNQHDDRPARRAGVHTLEQGSINTVWTTAAEQHIERLAKRVGARVAAAGLCDFSDCLPVAGYAAQESGSDHQSEHGAQTMRLMVHRLISESPRGVLPQPAVANIQDSRWVLIRRCAQAGESAAWFVILCRDDARSWGENDIRRAGLTLALIAASFEHPQEPGLSHVLLSDNGRCWYADPATYLDHLNDEADFARWAGRLLIASRQRWSNNGHNGHSDHASPHEVNLMMGSRPVWCRLYRTGCDLQGSVKHWLVEIRDHSEQDPPIIDEVNDQRVARAMGLLTDRVKDAPNLPELAEAVDTSPFHFHRVFSRTVGVSPKKYLLQAQMQRARWLLRTSRMSISQIAEETGFGSHGHFSATFNRVHGISPSAYRDQD